MTRVLKVAGPALGPGRGERQPRRARHSPPGDPLWGDPLWAVGRALHLLTPPFVVVSALLLHLLHNPLPVITLVTLVSGAYGKALWGDFLHTRGITDTLRDATLHDATLHDATPHDATARTGRDPLLAVQPTSR